MGRLARFGAIAGLVVLAGSMPALAQQKTLTVAAYGGVWDSHLRKEVFPEFEKKHGVKVEYVAGNSTDTLAKLQAQKGNQVIDVAIMDDGVMYQAIQLGFCAKIEGMDKAELYPAALFKDDKAVAVGQTGTGFMVNTKVFKDIAVGVSVPAALAIARYRFPGREAMTALFMSPLMIPHIVLGIAFLRFFTQIGIGGTFVGLVLAHIVIVLPFALRLTLASAIGLDRAVEHGAVSLGASEWVVLRRITLPLVLPGLASGWALAFINSFDEVTMTVFIAAPGTETLPVRMFLYIQDNIDPLVTSVSACVIAITVAALVVMDRAYGLEKLLVGRGVDGR